MRIGGQHIYKAMSSEVPSDTMNNADDTTVSAAEASVAAAVNGDANNNGSTSAPDLVQLLNT